MQPPLWLDAYQFMQSIVALWGKRVTLERHCGIAGR
jgi:hypothetical protein